MRLLLDTRLLVWAAEDSPKLSRRARELIDNTSNVLIFSVASIWEISIKSALGRADLQTDPTALRARMLANDFEELSILSTHAIFVSQLPRFHADPFDRILVAQAAIEGLTLLTSDAIVAKYAGSVVWV